MPERLMAAEENDHLCALLAAWQSVYALLPPHLQEGLRYVNRETLEVLEAEK